MHQQLTIALTITVKLQNIIQMNLLIKMIVLMLDFSLFNASIKWKRLKEI